ncbi:SDR family oxidoreductase [Mesorhizobium microcysteis]|uniref:SDR family oxidoreductase n=1 Tax=Neoaquamicrobium microcysteis TaxID=2682781 RepID=A0A5D4GNY4_9HYPH|nr:SDR family oxidoreductase [Mesorhizobium microcysteis]TYR30541.1 SDR family oxidoreductase [Mesorhizobium microcysteis]
MDADALFSSRGRTALITGGATGLGRHAAEALVRSGARVILASRKLAACEQTAAELSAFGSCEAMEGDISNEDGVRRLTNSIEQRCERLDILINNAGTTWGARLEAFPWGGWSKVLATNLTGLFSLTRDLVPMLEASAGPHGPSRVINIGSSAGMIPCGGDAYSYAASKAGVHHLTRILANELGPRGITVNAIAPGPFETKMTSFALEKDAGREHAASVLPLRRIGRAQDIAATVLFLCGHGGGYVTGAIIPVDGGLSVHAPPHLLAEDDPAQH